MLKLKKFFKKKPRVAVLRLSGVISSESGLFKKGLCLETIEEEIEKAFDVKNVKAVALQINSPGGSPVQSELIYNKIRQLSKKKNVPVYSFAEDVAASGGYWLLCSGDEMYAHGSSIVGSIGVVSAGFGFVEAIKKIGVERRVYHQGENKSVLDPFKKENPKDVEILTSIQKDVHEAFKEMVRKARGNKIKKDSENQLFSGEFWSGVSAVDLGLIDGIADMNAKLVEKFGKDVEIVRINKPQGWLKRKLSSELGNAAASAICAIEEKSVWNRYGL